jgi:hypothetical protein
MTAVFKAIAYMLLELIKHYAPKMRKTTINGAGAGEREARLRDKIKKQWKERG